MSAGRILHLLSQRPSLTGSGITLDALVTHAAGQGWDQRVVAGIPAGEDIPRVGGLPVECITPLTFSTDRESTQADLEFPVPGMSDVMPYRSTRFSLMTERQLDDYRHAFERLIGEIADDFRPDVIHSHHVWIVSSLLKKLLPRIPVVTHCHGTGLRQMLLCPSLTDNVREGCRLIDRFAVLHEGHARAYAERLELPRDLFHVVGAGYRDDVFHSRGRDESSGPSILYAGKFSRSKGLPWLLDALELLAGEIPGLTLHVAGGGSGAEADDLAERMTRMAPLVKTHGRLDQQALARIMRRCSLFVLPSLYEGLPLVLVEALACGCRPVCTDLPGIREALAPALGNSLRLVAPPRLTGVDTPLEADLPEFVARLTDTIRELLAGHTRRTPPDLRPFTWAAVFQRVETIWRSLL